MMIVAMPACGKYLQRSVWAQDCTSKNSRTSVCCSSSFAPDDSPHYVLAFKPLLAPVVQQPVVPLVGVTLRGSLQRRESAQQDLTEPADCKDVQADASILDTHNAASLLSRGSLLAQLLAFCILRLALAAKTRLGEQHDLPALLLVDLDHAVHDRDVPLL